MRFLPLLLLVITLSSSAPAATLFVDGPGDGDSNGVDDHDTISAALKALTPNGSSHEIRVMVNSLAPDFFLINGGAGAVFSFGSMPDDVTIEGDGNGDGIPCLTPLNFSPPYPPPNAFIELRLADHQDVVLRNLVLIRGFANILDSPNCILVSPADSAEPLIGATTRFEGITITASLSNTIPIDPDATPPMGAWVLQSGIKFEDTAEGSRPNHTLIDCTIAHIGGCALEMGNDYFSATGDGSHGGRFDVQRTRIINCASAGIYIGIWGGGEICLTRTEITGSLYAIVLDEESTVPDPLVLELGPGCILRDFGVVGIILRSGGNEGETRIVLRIEGTAAEPVLISGSQLGIDSLSPLARLSLRHAIFCGDMPTCVLQTEMVRDASPLTISNCLFVRQGGAVGECIRIRDDAVGFDLTPVVISIEHSTFQESSDFSGALVTLDTGLTAVAMNFSDCIFSGTSGSDYALDAISPLYDVTVTLDHCATVLDGPNALAAVLDPGAHSSLVLQEIGVISGDPAYFNTDCPPDEFSFDVTSPTYATAGPASGPLTGWGDFFDPTVMGLTLQ